MELLLMTTQAFDRSVGTIAYITCEEMSSQMMVAMMPFKPRLKTKATMTKFTRISMTSEKSLIHPVTEQCSRMSEAFIARRTPIWFLSCMHGRVGMQ
mmetsp:Transcript_21853/g.32564  ORF Transcript_21853/g.32564 Transcript_21853/m.32564 type:complete len:97 (+) Transcript_21853:788-1078(+)